MNFPGSLEIQLTFFRGRAFLYQDGDAGAKVSTRKKNVDGAYQKALEEANEIHERLKMERVAAKGSESRFMKPPPYVKLKVSTFWGFNDLILSFCYGGLYV